MINVIPQEHIVDYFVMEAGLTPAQVAELSITWQAKEHGVEGELRTVEIECYRYSPSGGTPVPSWCIDLRLWNGVFFDTDTKVQVSNVAERLTRYLSDEPNTHPLRLAIDELARLQAVEARLLSLHAQSLVAVAARRSPTAVVLADAFRVLIIHALGYTPTESESK